MSKSVCLILLLTILAVCPIFAQSPSSRIQPPTDKSPVLESRFARFDKLRVHYKNAGKGETALIFVHGWTCDSSFWQKQIPAFKNKVRVIAVDLPGHGKSDGSPQINYTPNLFARAINAVLADAGVKRAVPVGHSLGAPIVRQFYRLYPKKTAALVFVDGSLRPTASKENMEKFVARLRYSNYPSVIGAMADGMLGKEIPATLREELKAVMIGTKRHAGISAMEAMTDPNLWREDKINVPALAIFARSPIWKSDNEIFYRSLAPNLEYQMWDGVGHFLMLEKPQEFNESLTSFLVKIKFLKSGSQRFRRQIK